MKVIVINSAKGGVGKTTVAENLASSLAENDYTIAVVDTDTSTPNITKNSLYETHTLSIEADVTKTFLKKFLSTTKKKVDVDFLIIDTPPTITKTYSAIVEIFPDANFIFVTTADKNAIADTKKGIKFFMDRKVLVLGAILNMEGEFGTIENIEEQLGIPKITSIPYKFKDGAFNTLTNFITTSNLVETSNATATHFNKLANERITVEEIEKSNLPLKFFNLETWDYVKERLIKQESLFSGHWEKSNFGISTDELKKILDEGSSTLIHVNEKTLAIADTTLLPFELQIADIVYTNPTSKGLPMYKLSNGAHLWWHEASLADSCYVQEITENGIAIGDGRTVFKLLPQLSLLRMFMRDPIKSELAVIMKWFHVTGIQYTAKEVIFMLYTLEKEKDIHFEEFSVERYITDLKEYPEYQKHIKEVAEAIEAYNKLKDRS